VIAHWIRFLHLDTVRFGTVEGDKIRVFKGDMFDRPQRTDIAISLGEVHVLMPIVPGKVLALWNNFRALGVATAEEPMYVLKPPTSWLAPDGVIRQPRGPVEFGGALAIVIGATCSGVAVDNAFDHVFGYTCANDVVLAGSAPSTRARGGDTFCPFGPVIATGLNPAMLVVRTIVNSEVRQDFPVNDMVFSAAELVSRISHDMTLEPGDLILCGTSVGAGVMRAGSTVVVEIDGIGALHNRFA
jgi:2-keto-4-pentenoate hydratase/2-oxohepta-3-ene-1,7-dioic acid hydratase in catechol pathway